MTSGKYPWSFVTHIFHNGQPCDGGTVKPPSLSKVYLFTQMRRFVSAWFDVFL